MSCNLYRWTPECDNINCPEDCDNCDKNKDGQLKPCPRENSPCDVQIVKKQIPPPNISIGCKPHDYYLIKLFNTEEEAKAEWNRKMGD